MIRSHRFNYGRANRRQGTATTDVDRAVGWQSSSRRIAWQSRPERCRGNRTIALVDDADNEFLCFINSAPDGLLNVVAPAARRGNALQGKRNKSGKLMMCRNQDLTWQPMSDQRGPLAGVRSEVRNSLPSFRAGGRAHVVRSELSGDVPKGRKLRRPNPERAQSLTCRSNPRVSSWCSTSRPPRRSVSRSRSRCCCADRVIE